MNAFLDFLHRYKGTAAIVLLFIAGGLKATGHENISDAILALGTVIKVGFLPDGPSPKIEPNA